MAKGISLHLGLNQVDPDHYAGWDGKLIACEYDATDMESIALEAGYSETFTLLTSEATKKNFIDKITNISKSLVSGDIFFLSYSGHGDQRLDKNNDELDGYDETWCLYDSEIIDDEINYLLTLFKKGVRIFMLSDSCHSGTVFKSIPREISLLSQSEYDNKRKCVPKDVSGKIFRKNRKYYNSILKNNETNESRSNFKASLCMISGCQDNQFSYDGYSNGLFTGKLLDVWDDGYFDGNYRQFYNRIVAIMPENQTPKLSFAGSSNIDFQSKKPFII